MNIEGRLACHVAKPVKGVKMKRFLLQYLTKVVAEGVQFFNGKCVVTGITDFSVTIYDSIDLIDQNKKTIIKWIDF